MAIRRLQNDQSSSTINITPIIDIVFLLIIFFLLLSDLNKDKSQPMTLPVSSKVKKIEDRVAARVDIDKHGVIYLDGHRVSTGKDIEVGVGAFLEADHAVEGAGDEEGFEDELVPGFFGEVVLRE